MLDGRLVDVLKEQVFGFWRSLHCIIKNKRFHSPSLPQKFKHNCVCTVFLLAFQGTLKVEVWEPRGVEPQKDGEGAYFCLSFLLALSLSSTNGSGSFLLSVMSSNKDCRKESCMDYINCYLHHKRLCKNAVVWTQVFQKNIQYRGEIDQEGGIFLMEYVQTQSCCAYVLLFLLAFFFLSVKADGSYTKAISCPTVQ